MGWDSNHKKVFKDGASKFTFNGLKLALSKIQAEVQNWSPVILPAKEELDSLSVACNKLWDLDVNRLVPGKDYVINPQHGKSNIFEYYMMVLHFNFMN